MAFSPKNLGGQRHQLPGILRSLDEVEAPKLRQILAADFESVNWPGLADEMALRGYPHSVSTWKRWSKDFKLDPDRF